MPKPKGSRHLLPTPPTHRRFWSPKTGTSRRYTPRERDSSLERLSAPPGQQVPHQSVPPLDTKLPQIPPHQSGRQKASTGHLLSFFRVRKSRSVLKLRVHDRREQSPEKNGPSLDSSLISKLDFPVNMRVGVERYLPESPCVAHLRSNRE